MSEPIHVLYVDDNPLDRELVRDALEKAHGGFRVTEAASRQGFEACLAESDYDLVLSDFNILGFEGLDVIDAMRAKDPRVPVVIITDTGSEEVAVEAMKRGAGDYVIKTPQHIQRLPIALQKVLEMKRLKEERKRAEQALEALARGTASTTGAAFFPALVENLARALGMRWALVGQLRGGEREVVETLAMWDADHLADNITYDLASAPCQDLARKGFVIHADGVQTRFPQDVFLQEMGAECYVGAPLFAADGSVVGIVAALDDQPYHLPPRAEEIFQVFAARAAAELERMQKSAALEQAADEWRRTFDAMVDVVTIHDSEFRIVRANRAAGHVFGCEPEDLLGQRCYRVFHGLDCPLEGCPLHRSLQSGQMETIEIREPTIGKDLLVTSSPIRDAQDRMIGVIHVARDITEQKRTEATWRALNAAAAGLQRAGLTEAEVYQTATEQITALGLRGVISLLDEAADSFVLEHFFLPDRLLAAFERLIGSPSAGFRSPRRRVPAYAQVAESGEAIYIADSTARLVATLLPELDDRLADRAAGMLGPSNAILAPLRVENRVAGVLHVGSEWLTEADVPAITAFADQLSAALENARLYGADRRRTAELARANRLITALGQVAARIETAPNPDGVMETVGAELKQLEHNCFVALLEPDGQSLVVQYVSLDSAALALVEKLIGWKQRGFPLSRSHWTALADVIDHGRAVLITDTVSRATLFLPGPAKSVVERALQSAGVTRDTPAILLPLRVEEQVVGVLGMWGEELQEDDLEAAAIFASQVASAIERARLFDETRRRADELEALAEVSSALRAAGTAEEMVPIFLQKAMEAVGGIVSTIFLVEPDTGVPSLDSGQVPSLDSGQLPSLSSGQALVIRGWHPPEFDLTGLRHRPGEGITGHVAVTGEVYISKDLARDPLAHVLPQEADQLSGVRSAISLPLRAQEQIVGVMNVGLGEQRAFTDEEVRLLTAIAEMAGNALHRAILHEETQRRLQRITALRAIDMAISASLDLRTSLRVLLDQITTQLGADAATVLRFNPRTQTLHYTAGHSFRRRDASRSSLRLGEGLVGRAALERRTVSIADLRLQVEGLESGRHEMSNLQPVLSPVEVSEIRNLKSTGFVAYSAVPLIAKGQVKGVLELFHRAPVTPDPESLEFLEVLAAQAAIAIDNAELFDALQRSNVELTLAYDTTIEGWARALELHDKETEGHTRRVTEMTLRLARAMGVSDADLVHVRRGALLHDIGKMGIPDSILLKPGQLTEAERDIMRKHPGYAYEMLSPVAYLRRALDIPYYHHEKWDGSGYPHGLKGEEIPLPARIFAVVDVYDALRSDRPYREAWPEEKVLAHIREQAGKHFDPAVVDLFFERVVTKSC